MRIKSYAKGGYENQGMFSEEGGTLTGPLILPRDPSDPSEAATKQYVDLKLKKGTLNANNLNIGSVSSNVLPGYTGDLSNLPGSNIFSLPEIGIVPKIYTKPEFNSKGLVIRGNLLTESDIPNLPWSKITTNKPTNAVGWGITNAIYKTGGTLTGQLTAHSEPVLDKHPATLGYVRSRINNNPSVVQPGDIIQKTTPETPAGFLKCNGGIVSKSMYSELYSVIGDRFNKENIIGGGTPWRHQYEFNEEQELELGEWTTDTNKPGNFYLSAGVVTKNRVYVIGGADFQTTIPYVYYADILADGSLGTWVRDKNLPTNMGHTVALIIKNIVYVVGDYTTRKIISAPVLPDGSIGTWTILPQLPAVTHEIQVVATSSRLYIMGGLDTLKTYYSEILEDGSLGVWNEGFPIPFTQAGLSSAVIGNKVHLIGSNTTNHKYITTGIIDENGVIGKWYTTSTSPRVNFYQATIISTRNKVYALGGNGSNKIYSADVLPNNDIGNWVEQNPLPSVRSAFFSFVTSSRLYLVSGYEHRVDYVSFKGGKNDYSEYTSNTNLPLADINLFRLPNIVSKQPGLIYNYIKY